jgi:hypothetical protein
LNDSGCLDIDHGMNNAINQLKALAGFSIKAGILEGSGSVDGVDIAEYATWNEFGVPGITQQWAIPPRPFVRGYVDNHGEKINSITDMLVKQVADGKIDAKTAVEKLGKNTKEGIKRYIKTASNHLPNAEVTVKRKGTSRPLIDTGKMRDAVDYKVVSSS